MVVNLLSKLKNKQTLNKSEISKSPLAPHMLIVEMALGKLIVLEGCPLDNLKNLQKKKNCFKSHDLSKVTVTIFMAVKQL